VYARSHMENGPASRAGERGAGPIVWGVAIRGEPEGRERGQPQCCFFSFLVIFRVCCVLVLGASVFGPLAVKGTYQMWWP
jgi:hypothetical protein